MRLLMRVAFPPTMPNPFLAARDFEPRWRALLKSLGALAAYPREEGRTHYVLFEIEPDRITSTAEAVFRLAHVKPDFLPEIAPPPYYGLRGG